MTAIPKGLCQCGCGKKTKICRHGDKRWGLNRDEHFRFVRGHNRSFAGKTGANHPKWKGGAQNQKHILLAEKAIGHSLPEKAVVHHHTPDQLVVCQDQGYHMLLHQRQRALDDSGHADWRKCVFCKKWGDPKELYISPNGQMVFHRTCHAKYESNRKNHKEAHHDSQSHTSPR